MIPVLTALMLGFLHALEVDHMVAVTTFVTGRPSLAGAARFGFRWGVGHSLAVLLLGGGLLLTGLSWPQRFEAVGEGLVGVMLVGLGIWAIRSSRRLHLHPPEEHGDHAHLHLHGGAGAAHHHHGPPAAAPHEHRKDHHHHEHAGRHEHPGVAARGAGAGPTLGITLVGLLHGLAGTSAVVALIPVTLIDRRDVGFAYLAAFGVGVTTGMVVYATLAAYAMRQAAARSVVWGQRMALAVGVAGILVGGWWVVRAAGG